MTLLSRADIQPLEQFIALRQRHLTEVLRAQAVRRVSVGPHMTLLFENATTMRWQIHEMCRVEGLRGDAIDHELKTYNALLPTSDSLSATMLLEYAEPDVRDAALASLVGLEDHVFLELAAGADGVVRLPARFDQEQFNEARVSAVQFLRVPLDAAQRRAFADLSAPARIVVDHPAYSASTVLSLATRGALLDDLAQADEPGTGQPAGQVRLDDRCPPAGGKGLRPSPHRP